MNELNGNRLPEIDNALYPVLRVIKPLVEQEEKLDKVIALTTYIREAATFAASEERAVSSVNITNDNIHALCQTLVRLFDYYSAIQSQAPFCRGTLDALGTTYDKLSWTLLEHVKEELGNVMDEVPETVQVIAQHGEYFSLGHAIEDRVEAAFVQIRAKAVVDSLAASLMDVQPERIVDIVRNWNTTIIPQERKLAAMVFTSGKSLDFVVDNVTKPATALIVESASRLTQNLQNGIKNNQFGSSLLTIGILDALAKEDSSPLNVQIIKNFATVAKNMLDGLSNWLVALCNRPPAIPANGTVADYTSISCRLISCLLEHEGVSEALLQSTDSDAFLVNLPKTQVGFFSLAGYFAELRNALSKLISVAAKSAKRPEVALVFLINNYHYLGRNRGLATEDMEGALEMTVSKYTGELVDRWKHMLRPLEDIHNGKDAYKAFFHPFEEFYDMQEHLVIYDSELRTQLRSQLKEIVIKIYGDFSHRYTPLCNVLEIRRCLPLVHDLVWTRCMRRWTDFLPPLKYFAQQSY